MDSKELVKFCMSKGILIDKGAMDLLSELSAENLLLIRQVLFNISNDFSGNILTKDLFYEKKEEIAKFLSSLPEDKQKNLENFKIKLGMSIKFSKEISLQTTKKEDISSKNSVNSISNNSIKIITQYTKKGKSFTPKDFFDVFSKNCLDIANN